MTHSREGREEPTEDLPAGEGSAGEFESNADLLSAIVQAHDELNRLTEQATNRIQSGALNRQEAGAYLEASQVNPGILDQEA